MGYIDIGLYIKKSAYRCPLIPEAFKRQAKQILAD
jgi:hypothetical protein